MKLIFFLFILFPSIALAACQATPEIYHTTDLPKKFNMFNNLYRSTGSPLVADGNMIKIKGTLTDENCVPISDAVISIWHFNAYGKYQYGEYNADEGGIDKNFGGTGTSITNNMGEFEFITIFPGEYTNQSPFINFKVKHKDFITFYTRLFFSNKHDDLSIFSPEIANRLVAKRKMDDEYEFNISFVGTNVYLEY